ncbi:zinc-binding dehydrogenase [Solirubrobacter taibaiensis]|nr:zinc-binding dehydrogenase [Solirubrobacter taibaiensis]
MARALQLDGPRSLRLCDEPPARLAPRGIRVKALLSGVSHGTELSLYRGTSAFADRVFDRGLRAFVTPDTPAATYPATLGYELVGRVDETGPDVHELAPGDLVHIGAPHREEATLDLDVAATSTYPPVRLPEDAPLERWLFVSVGAVALVAAHDAQIKLGDHVAVVGLGAIGLLLVQMAKLAGAARVVAIDPVQSRRELALALGADEAIDPRAAPDGPGAALKRSVSRGVDVAVETSGATAGLQAAVSAPGLGGRVVTVGFYQGGAPELALGEEWHHNRLDMVSSMGAWGAPHRAYPAWDRVRVLESVVDLLATGAVRTDELPVRRFPFADAVDAYGWLDENPNEAVKVAFTYGGER